MKDQTRNLNPTPEAKVAMIIWGERYAALGGGSMDFWDSLTPSERGRCCLVVKVLIEPRAAEIERLNGLVAGMTALDPDIREAAYKARSVKRTEQEPG
jgi:hypothetical protein